MSKQKPRADLTPFLFYYYHADGLGSIVALTDAKGKVAREYQYDSFGNLHDQSNRIKQPYTYTGREWDRETGLYYYRARYYDAQGGRFISKDPIGFRGGINQFQYTGGNPVNRVDPSGLAYFALRRLNLLPWIPGASNNLDDDSLNLEVSHEQLFFQDGGIPSNIGFHEGGLFSENSSAGYRITKPGYNDCLMRKSYTKVKLKPYSLLGRLGPVRKFNCQDWAEEVRKEYWRLATDLSAQQECCLK